MWNFCNDKIYQNIISKIFYFNDNVDKSRNNNLNKKKLTLDIHQKFKYKQKKLSIKPNSFKTNNKSILHNNLNISRTYEQNPLLVLNKNDKISLKNINNYDRIYNSKINSILKHLSIQNIFYCNEMKYN